MDPQRQLLDDIILKEIARGLENDEQIDSLALALRITRGDVNRAHATNRMTGSITTNGTFKMLSDWRASVSPDQQMTSMKSAMTSARLIYLRDTVLKNVELRQAQQSRSCSQSHHFAPNILASHPQGIQATSNIPPTASSLPEGIQATSDVLPTTSDNISWEKPGSLRSQAGDTTSFPDSGVPQDTSSQFRNVANLDSTNCRNLSGSMLQSASVFPSSAQSSNVPHTVTGSSTCNNCLVASSSLSKKINSVTPECPTEESLGSALLSQPTPLNSTNLPQKSSMRYDSMAPPTDCTCDSAQKSVVMCSLTQSCTDACISESMQGAAACTLLPPLSPSALLPSDSPSSLLPSDSSSLQFPSDSGSALLPPQSDQADETSQNVDVSSLSSAIVASEESSGAYSAPVTTESIPGSSAGALCSAMEVATSLPHNTVNATQLVSHVSQTFKDLPPPGSTQNITLMMGNFHIGAPDTSNSEAGDILKQTVIVPHAVQHELSVKLNGESETLSNWLGLAIKLDLEDYIENLKLPQVKNPTAEIIKIAEQQKKIESLDDLVKVFERMKRSDCVDTITNYLEEHS